MLISFMLIKKEYKCLNIFEWLEVVKRRKYGRLVSPAVL